MRDDSKLRHTAAPDPRRFTVVQPPPFAPQVAELLHALFDNMTRPFQHLSCKPVRVLRLAQRLCDHIAQALFVGDIFLDEAAKALVLAAFEHGGEPVEISTMSFSHWFRSCGRLGAMTIRLGR